MEYLPCYCLQRYYFFRKKKKSKAQKNVKTLKEALLADFPKSGFLSYLGGNLWLDIFHLYVYFEQRNGKMRVKWKKTLCFMPII